MWTFGKAVRMYNMGMCGHGRSFVVICAFTRRRLGPTLTVYTDDVLGGGWVVPESQEDRSSRRLGTPLVAGALRAERLRRQHAVGGTMLGHPALLELLDTSASQTAPFNHAAAAYRSGYCRADASHVPWPPVEVEVHGCHMCDYVVRSGMHTAASAEFALGACRLIHLPPTLVLSSHAGDLTGDVSRGDSLSASPPKGGVARAW